MHIRNASLFILVAGACAPGDKAQGASNGVSAGTEGTGASAGGNDDADATDAGASDGTGGGGNGSDGPHQFPDPGPPGGDACPDLSCVPCGNGYGCAVDREPILEGTCCAAGDSLVHVAQGSGAEIVGLAAQGDLVVSCGGFGATFESVQDPSEPVVVGGATSRCQNAAFGPTLPNGDRVVYLAHHGDTWVEIPFMSTQTVSPAGDVAVAVVEEDALILFEGMAWSDGWLYVATHSRGVRVYATDQGTGLPSFVGTIGGFTNASRVSVAGDWMYVVDGAGGVRVLSRTDPASPEHVATIDIPGIVRNVAVEGDRAYLAAGGDGVFVFDVSSPAAPVEVGVLSVRGTAQAVAVNDDIIAVAAWTHVAVYDRETMQLLVTEHLDFSPSFEQDTSIAIDGNTLYVGEWKRMHVLRYEPGLIAPELWFEQELLAYPPDSVESKAVVVRNLGLLDLDIATIESSDPAFEVDETWLRVPPLSGRAFEVTHTPPEAEFAFAVLDSNDPDESDAPAKLPLTAGQGTGLSIGHALDERWAFLDPDQSPDLAGLEGKVIVLAYFALF